MRTEQRVTPDRLRIGVGNPYWPPGRVEVELTRTGAITILHIARLKRSEETLSVEGKDAAELIDRAIEPVVAGTDTVAFDLEPDEALYDVSLFRAGDLLVQVRLPASQLHTDKELCCVLRAVQALARPTTGSSRRAVQEALGDVPEGGSTQASSDEPRSPPVRLTRG